MKKIISLIASLSLLVASMAFAPVASAADEPTLVIDATKITDFTDYPSYNYGSDFDVYLISFNVTGLEMQTALGTGLFNKTMASGKSLASYSIQYTLDINGDKGQAWMLDNKSAMGSAVLDDWNGKVHTFTYGNGTTMIYPAKGTAAKITKNDKITVYEEIIVVAAGEKFTIDVTEGGCKIVVSEFADDGFVDPSEVESTLAVSDVTVPKPAAPAATEMVAGVDNITAEAHRGKSSISAPEVVAVADIAKITVENSAEAGRVDEWEAPKTLGNGKTNVLAIVTFDKAAMAGTTFTVKYLNSALDAIKTFTYKVQ